MGLGMEIYESITYGMIALDLLDAGLDYGFVHQLAKTEATFNHAIWLGICTTIALLMEIILKTAIQRNKRRSSANVDGDYVAGDLDSFNIGDKKGRAAFIFFCSLMELMIFFVEDATTLFVWWQTGLYLDNAEEASGLSKANLYITVASAAIAVVGLIYGVVRLVLEDSDSDRPCCHYGYILIVYLPAACISGLLVFWAWFSLSVILPGDSYNCIGSCNATYALDEVAAAAAAMPSSFDRTRRDADQDDIYATVARMLNLNVSYFFSPGWADALAEAQAEYGITTTTTSMITSTMLVGADVNVSVPDFYLDGSGEADFVESLYAGDSQSMNKAVIGVYAAGCLSWLCGTLFSLYYLDLLGDRYPQYH